MEGASNASVTMQYSLNENTYFISNIETEIGLLVQNIGQLRENIFKKLA